MLAATAACALALSCAPSAFAASPAPAWSVTVASLPTNFAPGEPAGIGTPEYYVVATNSGGAPTSGPITITDTLPPSLTLNGAATARHNTANTNFAPFPCTASGQSVVCTGSTTVEPGQEVQMFIPVSIDPNAPSSVQDAVTVSGGGAASDASTSTETTVASSPASFGFLPGAAGMSFVASNADGSPVTQAGSHPYQITINTNFPTSQRPTVGGIALTNPEFLKDLSVALPPGVTVNPTATPVRCTEAELESDIGGPGCPDASQVGLIAATGYLSNPFTVVSPLYNVQPPPGVPAELGFDALALGIYVHLQGGVRTGSDYALTASTSGIPSRVVLLGFRTTLWGDPSDPSHDDVRGACLFATSSCAHSVPASTDAFLSMPTSCSNSLTLTASADSWENPTSVQTSSAQLTDLAGNPTGITGCDKLDFQPSITAQPDTSAADSPSGLHVDLKVPQNEGTDSFAEANLKDTKVALPAGMSVNPSAANGLGACTPAEIGIDNANDPSCPDDSKIGSVEVDSPLLPDPLEGGIYVAQEQNNPFGSLLAIYVTAQADGALIKLAGHVVANLVTGQLTTTFDNNPQLPFSDFKLDFFGGPQAALATPEQCGTYTTSSSMSPWSGTPAVSLSDPFTINSSCVSGFSPSFTAGTQNAQAGAYSPFVLSFSRSDTDQNFSGLSVKLPPGMLAKLAGVQQCSDAQLAAAAANTGAQEQANPSCPAGSQVGTVTTTAGAGPDPFSLPGDAYLTGPYNGAPYGIAVVVPAVAGPYDLGAVVVREALFVDPTTAQVTDVSDSFPTILDGIPLRIRSISVDLNRPDFTVNPTSCNPMSVTGTLTSTGGLTYTGTSHFQVGGCQDIGFTPKLKIALTGKGKTKSGDHPTLTATLTDPAGQANIQSAKVSLPLSLALDPNNSNNVCAFATAQAVHGGAVGCPASTIVGTATAVTPLLSQPLTGNVYLVQGIRTNSQGQQIKTLPTLLVPLRGQIALDLRAQTSVSGGKLVTTFPTIPDAPVSSFSLKISGGKEGLLVVTGRGLNVCAKKQVGNADFGAQSGKTHTGNMTLSTPCGKAAKLRVVSKKMTADALRLKVQTSERGKVTVTGQQIASFGKMLVAGTHEIKVQVKHASTRGSRAKHATNMKVTVKLAPANAMPATKTLSVRT